MNTEAALAVAYSIDPIRERMLQVALLRDGHAEKRWRALRDEIDLDTFWDGRAINFLPLVYRALVDEGSDDPDLPRLRGVHRKTWYDNQLRFRSIAPALHALGAADVDVLALKGTAFAIAFYPDLGLRPMLDCDLLVRPGQVGRALQALGPAGWAPQQGLPQSYAGHAQELDVMSAEGAVIDLHWHIAQWLIPPEDPWNADDAFWDRSVAIEVSGAPARALDPTDAMLHSIVHGARHGCATHRSGWRTPWSSRGRTRSTGSGSPRSRSPAGSPSPCGTRSDTSTRRSASRSPHPSSNASTYRLRLGHAGCSR